ncbi:MAG: hypothetical protein CMI73_01640 [Candidatus Pelagibacter sp.]|mgnify:CR=1 FL=1|nr:hypothetical protein [Candidatus Pelagibacter sp.]|tara:strand:+ start:1152 stop:2066 length:915 start_codon:yes stop_codon:yes gene_type:complete
MTEFNFSIIIASVGRQSLLSVLKCLNDSTRLPKEVIICLPQQDKYEIDINSLNSTNSKFEIKIIKSHEKSQTIQRLQAFKNISCEFLMQMDDDLFFEKNFLEKMILKYNILLKQYSGSNICLAPLYRFLKNKKPVHTYGFKFRNNTIKLIYNLYFKIFHKLPFGNKKLGKVSCNSIPFGVYFSSEKIDFVKTEWLAGGCILMNSDSFTNYNHHPLMGKAYTEDIISSFLRIKEKKAKHFVSLNTDIFIEDYDKFADIEVNFFKDTIREFKSRLLYVKITKGNYLYFFFWYFLYIFMKVYKYVRK